MITDADEHADVIDAFLKINANQKFEFPHTNCDTYNDQQLIDLYFKPAGFGEFCQKITKSSILQNVPIFTSYIVCWFRLKFIIEQIDPVRFNRYNYVSNKSPKLPAELLAIYKMDTSPFYGFVDNLANRVQIQWIRYLLGFEIQTCDYELVKRINHELPTIRGKIGMDGPVWQMADPYEFSLLPFLKFHYELQRLIPVSVD